MRFIKMHGIGNDYVYVDCFSEMLPESPETLAVKLSRPHFAVGADGLILIEPSAVADARMRVFNSDGSEARMCGNGIRCVAKYLYDAGRARKKMLTIDTRSGMKRLELLIQGGLCVGATVDMGEPTVMQPLTLHAASRDWTLLPISMGNPHAACYLPTLPDDALFHEAGACLERDPHFPERANIEFCRAVDAAHIQMRVWERGSGETLACGTGACAAVVAGATQGLISRDVDVALAGGTLQIAWRTDNHVMMTGPAQVSFTGVWRS
ncbi:MAG: diaminopimelate epimerase [Clostridia bacterium]